MFDLFGSFQPLLNPIGFGVSDFIEVALAVFFVVLTLGWRRWIEPYGLRLARRTTWCMLLLAALPVVLRLCLLPNHPAATPDIYDEFSHLLVADTLRHLRFANPPHPFHRFFETFFVLQEPTYSSIYPIGQGLVLAIGWTILGHPWAGVVLSVATFCSLCYWMLRGWATPGWALLGGLLAVIEFGPLCQWMNGYWGGAVPAAAGCLVFGALPRLRDRAGTRDGALLGIGLSIHLLTRQYESVFLVLSVALYFLPDLCNRGELRRLLHPALIGALVAFGAVAITLIQNKQITGNWTTLPEALSAYQYGVPAAFTFQANPVPHRDLTPQQAMGYKMQMSFRGAETETIGRYLLRLEYRVRYYRFFFLAPLYLVLPFFLAGLREYRIAWIVLTAALFALGINFFPAFQFHYVGAVTCLFILICVIGLERLSRFARGQATVRLLLFLCFFHFVLWYSMHLFEMSAGIQAARDFETWNLVNHQYPEWRIAVNNQLAQAPGKQLVFVRYYPQHIFQDEWVYNAAAIDASRVVWARDLGPEENEKLCQYYPDRTVWLLEPDFRPPKLAPYERSDPEGR